MTSEEAWADYQKALSNYRIWGHLQTQETLARQRKAVDKAVKAYADAKVREALAEEEEKRRLFRERLGDAKGGTPMVGSNEESQG